MVAARLPPVKPGGTRLVSPTTTRTCSKGTPIWSATIWAKVVWWLWPWGICPVKTHHGAVRVELGPDLLGPEGVAPAAWARGRLDVGGHAEPEVAAFGPGRLLAAPELVDVDHLGDALEGLPGRDPGQAAAVDHPHRAAPRG